MKGILSERNLVAILFVMVLITFSFAQKETRKMEQLYNGGNAAMGKAFNSQLEASTKVLSIKF